MILLPDAVRIHAAVLPVNLHKSFEGLSNEVRTVLAGDPLSGHLFLFVNRTRTQVKVLMYTRGGFTIVHKRLERGRFAFPARLAAAASASAQASPVGAVEIEAHELSMLLEGLDVAHARGSLRWNPRSRLAA